MTEQIPQIRRTQCYKVIMSRGPDIQIDEEEIDKVMAGINEGATMIVKRGVINPSFFVSVVADDERKEEWVRGSRNNPELERNGIPRLKSIYGGTMTHIEDIVKESGIKTLKKLQDKKPLQLHENKQ